MTKLSLPEAMAMLEMAFNESPGKLAPDALRDEVMGWDSMGALMLIAELDERFGIELTPDRSREMARVSDVLDFLRTQGVLAD